MLLVGFLALGASGAAGRPAHHLDVVGWEPLSISFPTYSYTFDLSWMNPERVQTSRGYYSRLRIGQSTGQVIGQTPLQLLGVTVQMVSVLLSDYTYLIGYRFSNGNSTTATVDLAVYADTAVGGTDRHHVAAIQDVGIRWDGTVLSRNYSIAVMGSNYPLVSGLSACWLGLYSQWMANIWNSLDATESDGSDVGVAFSWQGISIPPGGSATRSLLVQAGQFTVDQPSILITSAVPGNVAVGGSFPLGFSVADSVSGSILRIFLVFDGDYTGISFVTNTETSGTVSAIVSLESYVTSPGAHDLSFYAVNQQGSISAPASRSIILIPTAVTTPPLTPVPTATPLPTQTPEPFPSAYPDSYPIYLWYPPPGYSYNFQIFWRNTSDLKSTYGYRTFLRVGSSTVNHEMQCGAPIAVEGITLQTINVTLSQTAILVIFKLLNGNSSQITCRVGVRADTVIHSNETHHVAPLPNQKGVYWSGIYGSDFYRINIIAANNYPLVSPLTTYWFGAYMELATHTWDQTDQPYTFGIDAGVAFSWQNIVVPAGGSASVSFIGQSGDDYPDQPSVTILGLTSVTVEYLGTFQATFFTSDPMRWTEINLFLVADDDISGITLVASGLAIGQTLADVNLATYYGLLPGSHTLSFYVVNGLGFVSPAHQLPVTVVVSAASPALRTVTRSQSPNPSPSPDTFPSPYPFAFPLSLVFPAYSYNFRLFWQGPLGTVQSSYGYNTQFMVEGGASSGQHMFGGQPATDSGVTIQMINLTLSSSTVLIVFKLTNTGTQSRVCKVAIYADTVISGNESHHVEALSNGQGFFWSGESRGIPYTLNVIGTGYPLVSGLSTYWYGLLSEWGDNRWNQTGISSIAGVDVAISFTWQQIAVPAGGTSSRSFIFRSGNHYPDQPSLTALGPPPASVPAGGDFVVSFSVSDYIPDTIIRILLILDGDTSTSTFVSDGQQSINPITAMVVLSSFPLDMGPHQFSFFAINDVGFVSLPYNMTIEISGGAPTTVPETPRPSQTLDAWPTPYPTAYPIYLTWPTSSFNFDVKWNNNEEIKTSYLGYGTVLQVGSLTTETVGGQASVLVSGITLETIPVVLSDYSVVLVFRLRSINGSAVNADVAIYADTSVGANESHHIAPLTNSEGVYWTGEYRSASYTLNVIAGNYPLTSALSTYWFGSFSAIQSNLWSQTNVPSSYGFDVGFAISWQGISVPAGGSSSIGFLLRSGNHSPEQPGLQAESIPGAWPSSGGTTVVLSISAVVPESLVGIFLLADGDLATLARVAESVPPGVSPVVVDLGPFWLAPGMHSLTFYAVDLYGFVSNGLALNIIVLPGPTATPAQTPTLTQSPLSSQSPAAFPSPYPVEYPLVFSWYASTSMNFNLAWRTPLGDRATTFAGYGTRLRVGSLSSPVGQGRPVTVAGVTLWTYNCSLSNYTVLIAFKLSSTNQNPTSCDVALYADTVVAGNEYHHIEGIPGQKGVFWSGDSGNPEDAGYTLSVIADGDYPLSSGLTTYWFGAAGILSTNYWTQTTSTVSDGIDVAFSIAWKDIAVPPNGATSISVIMRSGAHAPDGPTVQGIYCAAYVPASGGFGISILARDPIPSSVFHVFLVVDDDVASISQVASNLVSGTTPCNIRLDSYHLSLGLHSLTFYAVNQVGYVSNGFRIQVWLVVGPTSTPAKSPTSTRTPRPTQSPAPYPSPVATGYPLVLSWTTTSYNFQIFWRSIGDYRTSYSGYGTTLRVAGFQAEVYNGQLIEVSGVRLQTFAISLSNFTTIVVFKLTNLDATPTYCDLAIYADTVIGTNESHEVDLVPGAWGLWWHGLYFEREYDLNAIAGGYPLSTTLTNYWMGTLGGLYTNHFSQTELTGMAGQDVGVAISWLDVPLRGGASSNVVILFQSGRHTTSQPTISASISGQVYVGRSFSVHFVLADTNAGSTQAIFMVVDSDVAGIALVASDVVPGTSDQVASLREYPVTSGSHDFAFYAVNRLGWISEPASSNVFVVPAPATTLPQTPTLTQSLMASQSPDQNPSPSPYATCLPLLVTFGDSYLNFNISRRLCLIIMVP
jgi:hypothetical protein